MSRASVTSRMDKVVNEFVHRCRWFHQPLTKGRARMFALQHRLNTRQRNSVLKLKVAANCPDWDMRMRIIGACSEEVIADHAHGGGRPHWAILEDLGVRIEPGVARRGKIRTRAAYGGRGRGSMRAQPPCLGALLERNCLGRGFGR